MIEEFKQQCEYNIGSLKNYIYLINSNNALIDYKIDNKINVNEIAAEHIYKIYGTNVILTEEETFENRFKFNTTVNINIIESISEPWLYALNVMRDNNFYIVVENLKGTQFIQSVEFTSKFSYNYTFSTSSVGAHQNVLTFKCESNIPTMILNKNIVETQTLINEKCNYNIGDAFDLRLCNFKSTYIKKLNDYQFENIYTNGTDRYELIEFNKDSFSFVEQYSNNKFIDTITFSIPLEKYKFSFHYNLIEFKKNRYTTTFRTKNGNTIASGFEFGYFPSFTIKTSEDESSPNIITITLKHEGNEPLYYSSDSDPYVVDTTSVRQPLITIKKNDGTTLECDSCINQTQGVHTLCQEYTVTGQPINKYWCLIGYENVYSFLNIVGTYTMYDEFGKNMIFNSAKCAVQQDCQIIQSLPVQIIFTKMGEVQSYVMESTCDWSLSGVPYWLNASAINGKANQKTQLTLTTTKNPTVEGENAVIIMTSGEDKRQCNVILQDISQWVSPLNINCTAIAQTIQSFLLGDTLSSDVSIVDNGGTVISINQKNISIQIQNNSSEDTAKTYRVVLKNNKLNETKTITIIQDHIYVEWKWLSESAYICSGRNSYKKLTKFIGYTPTNINQQTNITTAGELLKANDPKCVATMSRWIDTNQTVCSGANKYKVQEEEISYDYGATWSKSGQTRTGSIIEYNSPDCSSQYTWVYENTNICVNGNLYKQYVKYYNNGTTLVPTGETKIGELIEVQSVECISAEENVITYTFEYNTLITNTALNNLKISTDTNFTVNWGDGTTNNYTKNDYAILKSVNHIWSKADTNTKKKYTVQITGGIRELRLELPQQFQTDGWFYTGLDLNKGINLNKFYVEQTKISSIDLTHNRNLLDFSFIDNYHLNGLTALTLPISTQIQYINIGNKSGSIIGYITETQLQKILDSLPQYDGVKTGLIDLCWNRNKDNIDLTCSLDYSALDTKNWFKSLPCCANLGSIKYQAVASNETRCDDDNFNKWSLNKLQQSTWIVGQSGTGYWGPWEDVIPYRYLLNEVKEYNSVDCGYIPTETYKWELTDQVICNGTTSFYQEQKYVSMDKGTTWNPVIPPEYQQSSTIKQVEDPDCGFIPPSDPIYRFVDVPGQYLCDSEDVNCLIINAWIPIGFVWNGVKNGGTFSNKTITTVPYICDGEKLYNGENLFNGLQLVQSIPSFNSTNIETMKSMFELCLSLTEFPSLDTAKVTSMYNMFAGCSKLNNVLFTDTKQVTDMTNIFKGCKNLVSVKGIDLIRCFKISNMFDISTQYNLLTTVEIKNCNIDLDMRTCFKVNHESLVYIIDNSIGSFVWRLPKSRADLLTPEEAVRAASKGINIQVN